MRYKITIKYKETCPKCKHKSARAAGHTRGGKRQFRCEGCGHRFPKGRKEYSQPWRLCSREAILELDNLILEWIDTGKIKNTNGIYKMPGIIDEITKELKKRLVEAHRIDIEKLPYIKKRKERKDYQEKLLMPSSMTIVNRIKANLKNGDSFTRDITYGDYNKGDIIEKQIRIPKNRQHYLSSF